jgi:hypothetical protein
MAQSKCRRIDLLFLNFGAIWGWGSLSCPDAVPQSTLVPIAQEVGWVPGPFWMDVGTKIF